MLAIVAVFGSVSVIARERCVPPAGTSAIDESLDSYRRAFNESGNRDLTIKLFDGADHEMLAGEPPIFVPGYVETMIRWLRVRGFAGVAR